ncbi:hypothetical protein [Yeguia hominis]|uniref:Uncharacterized protein n=1 Tax=Yeguia hominis TaxID=2763662 RepID=A0A926HLU7_9FIRM|nr:hypothetical protein [Yeguia hominis]MBC8532472.1 hypothetical protein [Yeguia hominis]
METDEETAGGICPPCLIPFVPPVLPAALQLCRSESQKFRPAFAAFASAAILQQNGKPGIATHGKPGFCMLQSIGF